MRNGVSSDIQPPRSNMEVICHTQEEVFWHLTSIFFFSFLFSFFFFTTTSKGCKYHIKHWEEIIISLEEVQRQVSGPLWGNYDPKSSSDLLCLSSSIVYKFEKTFTIHFRLVNMLLSVSISKQSRTNRNATRNQVCECTFNLKQLSLQSCRLL